MLLFATQRNAPLGNPKPLMRLWDAEGYLPRYTTRRSAALRASTRRFASRRNAPQLNAPFCIPKQSYCFGIPKGINCRPAAPRYAQRLITPLRTATQRSDFPAASAPGWPENHSTTRHLLTRRYSTHRSATQLNALKGKTNDPNRTNR